MTTQHRIEPDEATMAEDEQLREHLLGDHAWVPTVFPSPTVVEAVHQVPHRPTAR